MPLMLFGILAYWIPNRMAPLHADVFQPFLMLIFLVTCALPVVFLFMLKLFGSIRSVTLQNRKDRVIPFLIICVMYGLLTWIFISRFRLSMDDDLLKFMLISNALVLCSALITLWFKISIHSLAICGILGILVSLARQEEMRDLNGILMVAFVLAGLVMSSRLQLQVHTTREVFYGAGVGYAISALGMQLLF
jgi:hypothetical protein